MEEPSVLLVSVVSIGRIEVQMPDRVEKTKSIEAIVGLYDSQDNPMMLDRRDLGAYDLRQEVINPEVTAVKLDANQQEMGVGEIRYKVTGLELGETKILYFAGIGEQLVRSPAASIQVFPPLRLLPRNASIVVGSNVQIHSRGGPKPYVNVVYTVGDETVVCKYLLNILFVLKILKLNQFQPSTLPLQLPCDLEPPQSLVAASASVHRLVVKSSFPRMQCSCTLCRSPRSKS